MESNLLLKCFISKVSSMMAAVCPVDVLAAEVLPALLLLGVMELLSQDLHRKNCSVSLGLHFFDNNHPPNSVATCLS